MTFAVFARRRHAARGFQRQDIDVGDRQLGEVGQAHLGGIVFAQMRDTKPRLGRRRCSGIWPPSKPTLWKPPDARLLALVAAPGRLAQSRCRCRVRRGVAPSCCRRQA